MWIPFSALAIFGYLIGEIICKRAIDKDSLYAPFKLRISVCIMLLIMAFLMWALGLSESGMNPIEVIINHPATMLLSMLAFFSELCYLLALRYVGITITSSLSGLGGILTYLGMLILNLFFKRLNTVKSTLAPIRLIPIIIIFLGVFLLPNINSFFYKGEKKKLVNKNNNHKNMIIGIIITLIAVLLDAADSILFATLLADENLGAIDMIGASSVTSFSISVLLFFYLWKKEKKPYNPFKKGSGKVLLFCLSYLVYVIFTTLAGEVNAVYASIIWIAYPIFPILAGRLVLKEKYTLLEYICIFSITLASIFFCSLEFIL